jgi:hypothetical protein
VLVDHDGKINVFIVGVGGFLGVGEGRRRLRCDPVQKKDGSSVVVNSTKEVLAKRLDTSSTAPAGRGWPPIRLRAPSAVRRTQRSSRVRGFQSWTIRSLAAGGRAQARRSAPLALVAYRTAAMT